MKQILTVFFILAVFIISGCGSNKEQQSYQNIKFDSMVMQLPKWYVLVKNNGKVVDKFQIDLAYKEQSFSGFSSSLVIWKYTWQYPSDREKFFSIILEKMVAKLPWTKILSKNDFSAWNVKVYYFIYSVSNNLFDNTKPNYYWLQAYFFKPNQVYVLNYLTDKKNKLTDFEKLLRKVKLLK